MLPGVLGRAKVIDTEAGAAVMGDPGTVPACAKAAHRRSADAAREILLAEILNINLNPFQNLLYGFDTTAAVDNPLRYVLLSPVQRWY
jgi:hypothetical protein